MTTWWLTVGALLVLCYLPGAVLVRAPILDRARRSTLPVDERVFWEVAISTLLTLAAGVVLAATGVFRLTTLLGVILATAVVVALAARGRLRFPRSEGSFRPASLLPLGIAATGTWLMVPAATTAWGTTPAATMYYQGIHVARRGSLVSRVPEIASVDASTGQLFSGTRYPLDEWLPGFVVIDRGSGLVAGADPPVVPVSFATGFDLGGPAEANVVPVAWVVLGLLAFYYVGARCAGRPAATVAAILLALHTAHHSGIEAALQATLLIALLSLVRVRLDGDRFFAPVAAIAIALAVLSRPDALVAVAGIAAALPLTPAHGRTAIRLGWIAVVTGVGVALAWHVHPSAALYGAALITSLDAAGPRILVIMAAAGAALAVLAVIRRLPGGRGSIGTWLPAVSAVTILALGVTAYAVGTGVPPSAQTLAVRRLADEVLSLPGYAAALAGAAALAWGTRSAAWFLIPALAWTAWCVDPSRAPADTMELARRALPLTLPAAFLSIAALGFGGWRERRRFLRAARWTAGGALCLWLGGRLLPSPPDPAQPAGGHPDPAPATLAAVLEVTEPDDLTLVEAASVSGAGTVALTLAVQYDRGVLRLASARPDVARLEEFLAGVRARGGRVLFLGTGQTSVLSQSTTARPLGGGEGVVAPFYELARPHADPEWFALDVGALDDLFVSHFPARERIDGQWARWTGERSIIRVPALAPDARLITLWMDAGNRPADRLPAPVSVTLDGILLGAVPVGTGLIPYSFAIPEGLALTLAGRVESVELAILSDTIRRRVGEGTVARVGVLVDRVEVR